MSNPLTDKVKRTGGCACGEIRYGFYEPITAQVACHSRSSQYASGGGPAYMVVVRRAEFRITKGRPREFTVLSEEDDHVTRLFCGECGSPICSYSDADDQFLSVDVGSLDEPGKFKPRFHIWTSEAQRWHKRDLLSRRFRKSLPLLKKDSSKPET
jgi:hypothetical protein